MGRSIWTVLGLLACLSAQGDRANAQGFLKQLEDKVRSGLELNAPAEGKPQENPAQGKSPEELPAPQRSGQSSGQQGGVSTPSAPGPLSILESFSNPTNKASSPNATFSPPQTENALRAGTDAGLGGSGTYLGLEVEPVLGGLGIGVRIANVTQSSPAWRAGFRVGDVIQAIDGFAISSTDVMADRLSRKRPGETVKALVNRAGRNIELTAVLQDVALGERLHGFVPQNGVNSSFQGDTGPGYLGCSVSDLSQAFRLQFGVAAFRGAAVTNVSKGSPADQARIVPGDVIVEVNGRAIEASQDLVNWMNSMRPGDPVQLVVLRGQQPRRMEVTLGIDPKFASGQAAYYPPAGVPLASDAGTEELRAEVRQLRDELTATREQMELLQKRVEQLLEQSKR